MSQVFQGFGLDGKQTGGVAINSGVLGWLPADTIFTEVTRLDIRYSIYKLIVSHVFN